MPRFPEQEAGISLEELGQILADWWLKGGVSGSLGMQSWDQQDPLDTALGFAGGGITKIVPGRTFPTVNPSGRGAREALEYKWGKQHLPSGQPANTSRRSLLDLLKMLLESGKPKPYGGNQPASMDRIDAHTQMVIREMGEMGKDLQREIGAFRPTTEKDRYINALAKQILQREARGKFKLVPPE